MSSPTKKRLNELAERYPLPDGAVPQLQRLLQVVVEDETAPTSVREPSVAVNAHLADSLAALELDVVRAAGRIADLGAGAGFPGLVLAVALPDARVALVESLSKKCAFLERAVDVVGLGNVDVVCARAEEWSDGMSAVDVVTVRAVATLNVLAEYAAPLLVDGGTLVAYKGVRDPSEEADGEAAAEQLGLERVEIRPVEPFPGADHRHLYVYSKVRETPSRYPRRAGMARKRPLSTKG